MKTFVRLGLALLVLAPGSGWAADVVVESSLPALARVPALSLQAAEAPSVISAFSPALDAAKTFAPSFSAPTALPSPVQHALAAPAAVAVSAAPETADEEAAAPLMAASETASPENRALRFREQALQASSFRRILRSLKSIGSALDFGQRRRTKVRSKNARDLRILNSIFEPMLVDVHARALRLSDADILSRVKDLEKSTPIRTGAYERGMALFPDASSEGLNRSNAYNAENGDRHYDIKTRVDGQASAFLWVRPPDENAAQEGVLLHRMSHMITPIGIYGEAFARSLLRASQVLADLAREELPDKARAAFALNRDTLIQKTARADKRHGKIPEWALAPLATTLEGIMTFHQFLSAFATAPVPGAERGSDALRDIVHGGSSAVGLTTEFTLRLPMGLIGPMHLMGKHFEHGLARGDDGRLVLSEPLKALLKELALLVEKKRVRSACPVAALFPRQAGAGDNPLRRHTGLQLLAEAYWRIFQVIDGQAYRPRTS